MAKIPKPPKAQKHFDVVGIIMNIVLLILIIIIACLGIIQNSAHKQCVNVQSANCPLISCPCDDKTKGPCKGFATMQKDTNRFSCSNAPNNYVDINGDPIPGNFFDGLSTYA